MKKKTKLIILMSTIAVITAAGIITALVLIHIHKEKNKEIPVMVSRWNGEGEYPLCTIVGEAEPSRQAFVYGIYISTSMTMEEMIATNTEAFIGMETIYRDWKPYEAAIFYDNDSYFYIIENTMPKAPGYYIADCLYARWAGGNTLYADIRFPFPHAIRLSDEAADDFNGYYYYYHIPIFDLHDFSEMKAFYSRLPDDLYSIDEENQTITVKAYGNTNNVAWESGYKYEIVLDYKNRTISGPTRDGKTIVLTQAPDL